MNFIYNEISALQREGEVKIICLGRIYQEKFPYDNVKVITPRKGLISKLKEKLWHHDVFLNLYDSAFSEELTREVDLFKPDIIHCHFGPDAIRFIDNYRDTRGIPVIITFHGYDGSRLLAKKSYIRKLNRLAEKRNVCFIFVSEYMKKRFSEVGLDAGVERQFVLTFGIDSQKFARTDYNPGKKIFLQLSSLDEKKGHVYTLRAFSEFLKKKENRDWKFIFTGNGFMEDKVFSLIEELNLSDNVEYKGVVNEEQALELFNGASVFIHPSITAANGDQEGIPTAIMEAMAMELPVISTKHAGIPELLETGTKGILVEEKNVEEITLAMQMAVNWTYSKENRERIVGSFEIHHHNRKLMEIYRRILDSKKRSGKFAEI